MGEKSIDIALAILQAAIAISGLTLVYSAFLVSKAATYEGGRRADKLIILARLALVPVLFGFIVSVIAERVLNPACWGSSWSNTYLLPMFLILIALTALYAILAAFMGT
jgi:hypothetical protein